MIKTDLRTIFANIICLLLTLICSFGAVQMFIPMPTHTLWLASVVTNEFTLHLLILSAISLLVNIRIFLQKKEKQFLLFAVVNICTIITYVVTTIGIVTAAADLKTTLSMSKNLTGDFAKFESVEEKSDVLFSTSDGNEQRLDVYRKAEHQKRAGVIVIHGGSWRHGNKGEYASFNKWLASEGYVVFDINYRLAGPDSRFPCQLEDVETALRWICNNAEKFDLDKNRIFLVGRSSGAELALLTAYENKRDQRRIAGVVSYYAPTDLSWDYSHHGEPDMINTPETLENYLGSTPEKSPRQYQASSPLFQVTKSSPPTLLLQGGHDQIVRKENSDMLADKLKELGVPVEYVYLPWANHAFDFRAGGWSSQISRQRVLEFLRKHAH